MRWSRRRKSGTGGVWEDTPKTQCVLDAGGSSCVWDCERPGWGEGRGKDKIQGPGVEAVPALTASWRGLPGGRNPGQAR